MFGYVKKKLLPEKQRTNHGRPQQFGSQNRSQKSSRRSGYDRPRKKSYWAIVSSETKVTQTHDPRSPVTGSLTTGGRILIIDETSRNLKIIKPHRGWIPRKSIRTNCGWFQLTQDVAVVSEDRQMAPIKSLFGGTLIHIRAVYEKFIVIDEPAFGKINSHSSDKIAIPVDLHTGWYDVRRSVSIRVDRFRQSARVHTLRPGDKIQVVEVREDGVRISNPRPGWVSLLSHEQKPNIRPVESEVRIGAWHKVLKDTYVYKQVSSRSKRVGALKRGERVFVTERIGKSNRIDKPLRGWVRSISTDGYAILSAINQEERDLKQAFLRDAETFWDFLDEKDKRKDNVVVKTKSTGPANSRRAWSKRGPESRPAKAGRRTRSPQRHTPDRYKRSHSKPKRPKPKPVHKRHQSGYAHPENRVETRNRTDSRTHAPGWYAIKIYTLITALEDRYSKWVRSAKPGDRIHIAEVKGLRAFIDRPVKGWISLKTKTGQTVIEPVDEVSLDGDDTTHDGTISKVSPERDESETVEEDYWSDSSEVSDEEFIIGPMRDLDSFFDDTRERQESTLSMYKNPSMVLVGDSVVVKGRQGTVVGMKEDETQTLLSVQLDGDDLAKLVNEAEVLPVELALSKQVNLQFEMDELMTYFRDSRQDMKRRESIASNLIEYEGNSYFDELKSGRMLWESSIPEDKVALVVEDDETVSTISKLTALSKQDEVDALLEPLPPEKKKPVEEKRLEKKSLTGGPKRSLHAWPSARKEAPSPSRKYTRSRSNGASNGSLRLHQQTRSRTSSLGKASQLSSHSGFSRSHTPLERKAHAARSRVEDRRPSSSLGTIDEHREADSQASPAPGASASAAARERGMTELEREGADLKTKVDKIKQIAALTQQISNMNLEASADELMAKLQALMEEPTAAAAPRGKKSRDTIPRGQSKQRASVDSIEFSPHDQPEGQTAPPQLAEKGNALEEVRRKPEHVKVEREAKAERRPEVRSPVLGAGAHESPLAYELPKRRSPGRSSHSPGRRSVMTGSTTLEEKKDTARDPPSEKEEIRQALESAHVDVGPLMKPVESSDFSSSERSKSMSLGASPRHAPDLPRSRAGTVEKSPRKPDSPVTQTKPEKVQPEKAQPARGERPNVNSLLSESNDLQKRLEALRVEEEFQPAEQPAAGTSGADLLAQLNEIMSDGAAKPMSPKESPRRREQRSSSLEKPPKVVESPKRGPTMATVVEHPSVEKVRAGTKSRGSVSDESRPAKQPVHAKPKRKSKVQGLRDMWEKKLPPSKKRKPNKPRGEQPPAPAPVRSPKRGAESPKLKREEDREVSQPRRSILKKSESMEPAREPKPKKSITFSEKSAVLLPDNEIGELATKRGPNVKPRKAEPRKGKKAEAGEPRRGKKEPGKKAEPRKPGEPGEAAPQLSRPVITSPRRKPTRRRKALAEISLSPLASPRAAPTIPQQLPQHAEPEQNEEKEEQPMKSEAREGSKPLMTAEEVKKRLSKLKKRKPSTRKEPKKEEEHILGVIANARKSLRKTKTKEMPVIHKQEKNRPHSWARQPERGEITVDMVQDTLSGLKKSTPNSKKDYSVHRVVQEQDDSEDCIENGEELDWNVDNMKRRENNREEKQREIITKRKSRVENMVAGFQTVHEKLKRESLTSGQRVPDAPCPLCGKKIFFGAKFHVEKKTKYHLTCWSIEQHKVSWKKNAGRLRQADAVLRSSPTPKQSRKKLQNEINTKHRRGPSLSICGKCKKQVFLRDNCTYFGRSLWHRQCFRCNECDRVVQENERYRTKDKTMWCEKCYRELFPAEVSAVKKSEHTEPMSVLKFEPTGGLKKAFSLIRHGQARYVTMRVKRKFIVPYFWRLRKGNIEMMPPESQIDFDALASVKVPRKIRNKCTTPEIFQEFVSALTIDGPSFGTMLFTFKFKDHRIYDKLVLFFWLPPDTEKTNKVLYGIAKGALPEMFRFQATIATQRLEDLEIENVKKMLAG